MKVKVKNMLKVLLLGSIILAGGSFEVGSLKAQDPLSSQYYANQLFLNPAMAGVEGLTKVSFGYRNQWPAAAESYSTYHAAYEQYLEPAQGGIGVHLVNDRQGGGIFNTMSLDAMYSYHLKVSRRLTVTGGLQASVGQRNFNGNDLLLPDDLNNSSTTRLQSYSRW
jgi:type IX secretion system PorP/SprF family membrane protein